MDPRWLFPVLAAGFALAAWFGSRSENGRRGAARTWVLMAAMFGGVSLWLHLPI